jgi:hypothetical protein
MAGYFAKLAGRSGPLHRSRGQRRRGQDTEGPPETSEFRYVRSTVSSAADNEHDAIDYPGNLAPELSGDSDDVVGNTDGQETVVSSLVAADPKPAPAVADAAENSAADVAIERRRPQQKPRGDKARNRSVALVLMILFAATPSPRPACGPENTSGMLAQSSNRRPRRRHHPPGPTYKAPPKFGRTVRMRDCATTIFRNAKRRC